MISSWSRSTSIRPTQARALADQLRGVVGGFKIGSRLFTSHGPSFVEHLVARGDRVFLDLKFHDIPNTVAGAVAAATRLGVWMVNVHASGGHAMMKAARDAADAEAAKRSRPAPLVIAVTMLTSLSEETLGEIGIGGRADRAGRTPGRRSRSRRASTASSPRRRRLRSSGTLRRRVRDRHAGHPQRVGR